jgi:hypothetical protein
MYPIAYRSLMSLHEDDVAAVTALYPTAGVGAAYGQLNGTFTTSAGAPILGANIWAREVATGKVYSVVSDFLTQGNGYFRFYLAPGTYTLNAESIASNFTGGSGVGPYSDTSSSASFQPPHPIAPIALGGGSGQQIAISAGCLATASFRLDGTGSVSGNCGGSTQSPTTTALATSGTPALAGATVTFTATVTGANPTGNVSFNADGGGPIAGCGAVALSGSGNSRNATCATNTLASASTAYRRVTAAMLEIWHRPAARCRKSSIRQTAARTWRWRVRVAWPPRRAFMEAVSVRRLGRTMVIARV